MRFSAKGSLSDAKFIEILKDAAQSALTGMIRLENGPIIKVVYFQKGTISFASSNEKTDRLTEVLKRAGKLTPEQVEDAQARLKPNVSLGKTLVELGYISAKDLLWGARTQVDGILHQLLFWNQGKYQLMEGTLPREIIHLNLPVTSIIFEGIMKTQDRDWILQHIGSPDAIYQISINVDEHSEPLKLPVSTVTSKLNGKRSLHEIAQISGMDTFELCKTVVALEYLDLAHPIQDEPLQMELNEPGEKEPFSMALEDQPVPTEVDGARQFSQALQSPAVEEIQGVPPKQEEPVNEPENTPVLLVETPAEDRTHETPKPAVEETVPVQVHREIETPEPEADNAPLHFEPLQATSVDDQDYDSESETTPIWNRSTFNWKGLIAILFLGWAVGLGAFYYLRKTRDPEVRPPVKSIVPDEQPQENEVPAVSTRVESAVPEPEPPLRTNLPADNPLTLLRNGRLPDAAKSWRKEISKNRSGYSIQLVIACQEQTVLDTHQLLNYSREIIVLPVSFKGQNCYRVLFGQYASREFAQAAIQKLPDIFVRQRSPATVVALSRVLS